VVVTGVLWALCALLLWIVVGGASLAYTTCGAASIVLRSLEVALLFPALVVAVALGRTAWHVFMGQSAQAAEVLRSWAEQYGAWYRRGPQLVCLLTILLPLALWSMLGRYEVHQTQTKRGGATTVRSALHDRLTGRTAPIANAECATSGGV
jgi:hypothetical protein